MKKVTLSLDSSLKEIFTYEESRAVFDKFLPGMRTMAEKQPATLGFSVRKIIQFSGGAIPAEAADALDAALCALELYSAEPEMSDTPLTPDGAEIVSEPAPRRHLPRQGLARHQRPPHPSPRRCVVLRGRRLLLVWRKQGPHRRQVPGLDMGNARLPIHRLV